MLKTFDLLGSLGLEAKWKDIVKEKALGKRRKNLVKRQFFWG